MTEQLCKVREVCSCGAQFTLEASIENITLNLIGWRNNHACTINKSELDWRLQKVGLPCDVCDQKLMDANTLTTVQGVAIHTACRICKYCQKPRPFELEWVGEEVGLERETLVHAKCANALRKAVDDPSSSVGVDSDGTITIYRD